jgi:hypothetical protein
MTTSGTITYQPSTNEIITGAFNLLGVCQEGEALTPRQYSDGLRGLNGLIQTLSAFPHLWTATEGSLALVADQPSYVVSPRALRIVDCRYRLNGIDVPMTMFSRQEYFDQPNKTVSPSIPVNFYFDPKVADGTLYLWPCPSAQAAAQYTIHYTYVKFLEIQTATNQTLDIPQQWIEAIMWNLAKRLATQYPVNDPNLMNLMLAQAQEYWDRLTAWDNEPASLFMQADYTRWSGFGGRG